MNVTNAALLRWVEATARLTRPDRIVWLDGSQAEADRLLAEGVSSGQLIPLHPQRHPNSYLHRSHPLDVARTEQCTFVCTRSKEDAGPNNNWMEPGEAYAKLRGLFDGVMRGRTMYVIPYLLGPPGSLFSKVGFELTDSVYVAVNMRIMTRMGTPALDHLGNSDDFIQGLHSVGTLDPQRRYICHFPEDRAVWSLNSGYGGNALLSKKCAALRLAGWLGKTEGWLAEHMLIAGIEDPRGKITYIAAAFPSACGKTYLAMLQPSGPFKDYRIWCVGDDIAWLRVGQDGRLYAVNPEAGFFGVAPGTSLKTNPNMMRTIDRNTIFTNVGMTQDRTAWWEGLDLPSDPSGMVDWQGKPWTPGSGQKAAHPNSRFTAPITQCPVASPEWNNPDGVPISAILFGCRRSRLVPLVCESLSWVHGVYVGATLNSETTAASTGTTGVVRRDPMAMWPFCGYNMADYFAHWIDMGRRLTNPPKIYRVNWFRTDERGAFIWPGFGENMRVLRWIMDRVSGDGQAIETPIGSMPPLEALNRDGLSLSRDALQSILEVDRDGWLKAAAAQAEWFEQFGSRWPSALRAEQHALVERLTRWRSAEVFNNDSRD